MLDYRNIVYICCSSNLHSITGTDFLCTGTCRKEWKEIQNDEYGSDVAGIIVSEHGQLIAEDLWNGYDAGALEAISEYLQEKGISVEGLMPELEPDELAYKIDDRYFAIQRTEEGYDYTFYALNYDEIDGGAYDNPDVSMRQAMEDILEDEDILEYNGVYYTLSETRMPFKADKTVDEDYFILTLFSLALEAKERGITLSGKDIVLGVGLPPADFGQQAPGFKKYFMERSKHGISFRFNGKPVNCYLKDVLVSPQNFAAVMCYKASLFRQYRTVNCIDIGDGTVDLLVIRKGQPDLSVRVSDRSGMAILRSEISNSIQQNYGIHLESSDVEQVLMQEATILDEEVVKEIQKMAGDWMQRIINKLHAYVPDFRTNPAVFLGGGSLLLKQQIEKSSDFKYIEFIEDIRANAVGYEKMTALHIQKRQGV